MLEEKIARFFLNCENDPLGIKMEVIQVEGEWKVVFGDKIISALEFFFAVHFVTNSIGQEARDQYLSCVKMHAAVSETKKGEHEVAPWSKPKDGE